MDQLANIPNSRIISALHAETGSLLAYNERYVQVEFSDSGNSEIVDEAEFYFTPNDNTVQFRSIRRGSGLVPDFGANRDRLERLRIALRWESVPVLRNRRRVLFFGESPLDGFGPPTIQFEKDAGLDLEGGISSEPRGGGVRAEMGYPLWETARDKFRIV